MTNKEKCLKMWQWLADNPDKEKMDFFNYCIATQQEELIDHKYFCWACVDAEERKSIRYGNSFSLSTSCQVCPITWTDDILLDGYSCMSDNSPYEKWRISCNTAHRKIYTMEIAHLIQTTWKE